VRHSRCRMAQILSILKEAEAGAKGSELGRRYGKAEQTVCRGEAKDGGMSGSDGERLRQLEVANAPLKRPVAAQALDILVFKAAPVKRYAQRRSGKRPSPL
jgi:putative transposase